MDSDSRWKSAVETGRLLGIAPNTLRDMRRDGRLEAGRHWIWMSGAPKSPVGFDPVAIDQWRQEATKQRFAERNGDPSLVETYDD